VIVKLYGLLRHHINHWLSILSAFLLPAPHTHTHRALLIFLKGGLTITYSRNFCGLNAFPDSLHFSMSLISGRSHHIKVPNFFAWSWWLLSFCGFSYSFHSPTWEEGITCGMLPCSLYQEGHSWHCHPHSRACSPQHDAAHLGFDELLCYLLPCNYLDPLDNVGPGLVSAGECKAVFLLHHMPSQHGTILYYMFHSHHAS
jgi:hypothetical protein